MRPPLEAHCEDYFIELLKLDPVLSDLPIKAFDVDAEADAPGIVVRAVQKERRLDGPKGFDVDMTVLYRSTTTDAATNSKIADAITHAIYGAAPGLTTAETMFTYLLIFDEMTGDRENDRDLRKREKAFVVRARIDDTP
jgi:hypothetical protein